MTQCPACAAAVKPTAPTCECEESLEPWRVVAHSGAALRDRGLALAADGDYLGAALALLPAALTNPFDTASLVDAARALIRLGRIADAVCWLEAAGARPGAAELLALANERLSSASATPGELPAADGPTPAPDTRRPLLAGRPVLRKYGKFRGKPSKEAVAEWERVIEMEADPKRDWRPRGSAVEELVRADARAVYHYALGLGAWQAGDAVTARAEFRRCVAADPPVLNPAVYLIYAQDDQPESARGQVLAELGQKYSDAELDQCLAALRGRRAEPDSVGAR